MTVTAPASATTLRPDGADAGDFLLCRQPILDRDERLFGYALALGGEAGAAKPGCQTGALLCAAYAEFGLRNALGAGKGVIAVDADFIHDDAIEALPPDAVVLRLAFDAPPDRRTLARCHALRERRYALSLGDYRGLDARSAPLLASVDIVHIDTASLDDATVAELAGSLAHLPIKRLATGVDTPEDMRRCHALGFHLLQGRYFAHPEIVPGRSLSASQAALIQLIRMAAHDTDTARIEEGIKREPALAVNLLRIVNSVHYGLSRRITSLRAALAFLGRRQLQRWLQLLLMAPRHAASELSRLPLLQVAALRGRMMELLARHLRRADETLAEQAFIVGIMSMMPAALALPLGEILEQIALEAEVADALRAHAGLLGQLLALIEAFDAEEVAACDALIAALPDARLTRNALNACFADALRWIGDIDTER